jgi:hypothetical protein
MRLWIFATFASLRAAHVVLALRAGALGDEVSRALLLGLRQLDLGGLPGHPSLRDRQLLARLRHLLVRLRELRLERDRVHLPDHLPGRHEIALGDVHVLDLERILGRDVHLLALDPAVSRCDSFGQRGLPRPPVAEPEEGHERDGDRREAPSADLLALQRFGQLGHGGL